MGRNYKNIKAWQHANKLTEDVYKHTTIFPKQEIYGITSQLRRAAVSVPCNIVEGANRGSEKEYIHFLCIAKGSLAETEYLISLAKSLKFLNAKDFLLLDNQCQECMKTLTGLIQFLRKSII